MARIVGGRGLKLPEERHCGWTNEGCLIDTVGRCGDWLQAGKIAISMEVSVQLCTADGTEWYRCRLQQAVDTRERARGSGTGRGSLGNIIPLLLPSHRLHPLMQ